jgi:hypothetical protein
MIDALEDPRTEKLMKAVARRFPRSVLTTRRWHDDPHSGELVVEVLNAPSRPPRCVEEFARPLIWKLWGDGPHPVSVWGINREKTAKYHADELARAQAAARRSRRRARPAAKRRAAS